MNDDMNMMQNGPEVIKPKKNKSGKTNGGQKFLIVLIVLFSLTAVGATVVGVIGDKMKMEGRIAKDESLFDGFMAFVNGTDAKAFEKDDKNSSTDKKDGNSAGSVVADNSGKTDKPHIELPEINIPTINIPTINIPGVDDNNETPDVEGDAVGYVPNSGGYVTKLGQYKGITVEYSCEPVTDGMIDEELYYFTEDMAERTTLDAGIAEMYDEVSISCEGFIDGKKDDNCTLEDFDLFLGSGQLIPGFEEGVVGHRVGETFSIDLAFPDPYTLDESLSGKDVMFNVTLNNIYVTTVPELTDELVAENTDYATVAEYREYIKSDLEEMMRENAESQVRQDVIVKLIDSCEFNPEIDEKIEEDYQSALAYYDQTFNTYYGADAATIYEMYYGISADEYRQMVYEESEQAIKYFYVQMAIAEAENMRVNPVDYEEKFAEVFFDQYGFTSKEEVLEIISEEEANSYVIDPIFQERAEAIIMESAVVNRK